jgi:hypothetical protein
MTEKNAPSCVVPSSRQAGTPDRDSQLSTPRESGYVNYVPASGGRVRAVCECCGRRSKPCQPDKDGEPRLWDIGSGWSEAPYPHDFKHDDGSVGSTFSCPACNKRLDAGEAIKVRNYIARKIA